MGSALGHAVEPDPAPGVGASSISDREFAQFQSFIFDAAGITLANTKKALVSGRLAKRLKHFELDSYGDYFRLITGGKQPEELQTAVDLLTTNETYFFREPQHFEFLKTELAKDVQYAKPVRVWSAAASTGEEPYSIAMLLEECLGAQGRPWEIVASDISMRVLERAATGHYQSLRTGGIPPHYLRKYCLKGTGQQAGTILVDRKLRQQVQFRQINLNSALPQLGTFDFIFLRNVLLYFNLQTKRQVVSRVLSMLKPGGWLFISHTETLHDVSDAVDAVRPATYRKR
ncbi:MAG TPA: protein-glutamate O-methyltransferase CheR [Steroidobacteraceae bacterium]|nr:protein-glutamate O-methyltransferase CheR [Steroidobacteraceae bacterium]